MPYEYAIVYNSDYSVRYETTFRSKTIVGTRQYDSITRNGGHTLHNHPPEVCSQPSYQDVENAMLTNLSDTIIVGSDGRIRIVVRKLGGWKYFSEQQFEKVLAKYNNYDFCISYDKAWQELGQKYNFMYLNIPMRKLQWLN